MGRINGIGICPHREIPIMFRILGWVLLGRASEWHKVRNDFVKINDSCSGCGTKKMLQVHHKIPVSVDPTKELDEDNLITLCSGPANCHLVLGHLLSYSCYNPNVVEDCQRYLNKVKGRICQKKV